MNRSPRNFLTVREDLVSDLDTEYAIAICACK